MLLRSVLLKDGVIFHFDFEHVDVFRVSLQRRYIHVRCTYDLCFNTSIFTSSLHIRHVGRVREMRDVSEERESVDGII